MLGYLMTGVSARDILVGTGGWAYFHVPGRDSLRAYSSSFNFVEVNSTYYEYSDPQTTESWRTRVPGGFEFSVRCHRDIVHALRKESQDQVENVLAKMTETCRILDA